MFMHCLMVQKVILQSDPVHLIFQDGISLYGHLNDPKLRMLFCMRELCSGMVFHLCVVWDESLSYLSHKMLYHIIYKGTQNLWFRCVFSCELLVSVNVNTTHYILETCMGTFYFLCVFPYDFLGVPVTWMNSCSLLLCMERA